MSLISVDPLGWVDAWKKRTKLFQWVTLVTTLAFSGVVSFLGSCGASLTAHRPTAEAIGMGMITAGAMMTMVWRRSPITKNTIVALPAEEAKAELKANAQVITK